MILPKGYKSELNLYDTQIAIKTVKDFSRRCLPKDFIFYVYPHLYLLTPLPV